MQSLILDLHLLHDGRLNIDNITVENSIRPVALGRKNYLFAGSHEAAKRSGMLYSLLGTCKILQRIADHPINKIQDLLPHHYKAPADLQLIFETAKMYLAGRIR